MNILRQVRKWIFWEFGRNSIPYEIVCAVYICLLVFLPTGSNGFFDPGTTVDIAGTNIELQRQGTKLYCSWDGEEPDQAALEEWARDQFGAETVFMHDTEFGPRTIRIKPGGWTWRNILPF